MATFKKTATTTRGRNKIKINAPGTFYIKDPVNIKNDKGVFWFNTNVSGVTWLRSDLIIIAKWLVNEYYGKNYVGTGKPESVTGYDPAFDLDTNWVRSNWPQIVEKVENTAPLTEAPYTDEELAEMKSQQEAGELNWWDVPNYNLEAIGNERNNQFLNIGGLLVSAATRYPSGMVALNPIAIKGNRKHANFSCVGKPRYFDPKGHKWMGRNTQDLGFVPVLTLMDPKTAEPDWDKTAEWYEGEDPEFMAALVAALPSYASFVELRGGVYISESWKFLNNFPDSEPQWADLPSPADAISAVTKLMQEDEMCPDVAVAAAEWAPIMFTDNQPLYDDDGNFTGYDPEKKKQTHRWGLRVVFKKRGGAKGKGDFKGWGSTANICAWAAYRPDIDEKRPWRLIKSTNCQRKNNWSKTDSSIAGKTYMNQIEPDVEHALDQWAVNSMAQMANDYPLSRQPEFIGSKRAKKATNRLQSKLKSFSLFS